MKRQLGVYLAAGAIGAVGIVGCGASDNNNNGGTTGLPGSGVTVQPPQTPGVGTAPAATAPVGATNPAQPTGTATNPGLTPPPTAGGAAGSGAADMVPAGGGAPTMNTPAMMGGGTTAPPTPGSAPAMDECGLHTQYAGDEYCILPPPPDKGFQLHIGPSNYDNPEPQYLLAPSQETTNDFPATSGNDQQVYFYYRQFRQRPGAHHNIITSGSGGDTGLGQRIGTSNLLSEDYPEGGIVAPENMDVGVSLPAHSPINVSLHSINTTQKTELREVWVNFWYVDPSTVKEPVKEIFDIAPQNPILPGADVTYGGSCTVSGTGRMLWMYGHRHANNVRFSAWRIRGGKQDLIYQGYNFEEPLVLDYSSTVTNPVADTGPGVEGGWSGILDMMPGDQFKWECHVINQTTGTLLFTNNTYTGEMCILDAETVGATCP